MKKLILVSAIALSFTTPAMAQGIPTYDATAVMKMIEQATAMANQLVELKNQVKALTDFKGFAEELTGIGDEINNALASLKDLKEGITSGLGSDGKPVTVETLRDLYSEQLEKQMAKVEELSKRIQQAPDTKAMSEIQAEIGLRQQAADIMKQQKELADQQLATKLEIAKGEADFMLRMKAAGVYDDFVLNKTGSSNSRRTAPSIESTSTLSKSSSFDDILRN